MNQPKLKSVRIKNFKAVQDSKSVKFTPLTVLIGDNGSGKSSLIEGLETIQMTQIYGDDLRQSVKSASSACYFSC